MRIFIFKLTKMLKFQPLRIQLRCSLLKVVLRMQLFAMNVITVQVTKCRNRFIAFMCEVDNFFILTR